MSAPITNVLGVGRRAAAPREVVGAAIERWGQLDVLVDNAGAIRMMPPADTTADGIRVNAVAPGPTESDALAAAGLPEAVIEQAKQHEAARIPLGRRGEPEEVAEWIPRLADPDTTWLTGQVLTVDGGLELV